MVQPEKLEIQLGESWAGVAFELKTDAGMYPGVIPVGEDGILRLEIGGSTSYILTCMNSEVEIPEPDAAQRTEGVSEAEDTADTLPTEDTEAAAYPEESTAPVEADMADGTVSGIPIAHLALFGGGLIVAVGVITASISSKAAVRVALLRTMMKMTKLSMKGMGSRKIVR